MHLGQHRCFHLAWLQEVIKKESWAPPWTERKEAREEEMVLIFKVRTPIGGENKRIKENKVLVVCWGRFVMCLKSKGWGENFLFVSGKGLKWLVLWRFSAWALVWLFAWVSSSKSLECVLKIRQANKVVLKELVCLLVCLIVLLVLAEVQRKLLWVFPVSWNPFFPYTYKQDLLYLCVSWWDL